MMMTTTTAAAAAKMMMAMISNPHVGLVLILAGAVCYIFICFWYISTVS
jgi:hypothetical protein